MRGWSEHKTLPWLQCFYAPGWVGPAALCASIGRMRAVAHDPCTAGDWMRAAISVEATHTIGMPELMEFAAERVVAGHDMIDIIGRIFSPSVVLALLDSMPGASVLDAAILLPPADERSGALDVRPCLMLRSRSTLAFVASVQLPKCPALPVKNGVSS